MRYSLELFAYWFSDTHPHMCMPEGLGVFKTYMHNMTLTCSLIWFDAFLGPRTFMKGNLYVGIQHEYLLLMPCITGGISRWHKDMECNFWVAGFRPRPLWERRRWSWGWARDCIPDSSWKQGWLVLFGALVSHIYVMFCVYPLKNYIYIYLLPLKSSFSSPSC